MIEFKKASLKSVVSMQDLVRDEVAKGVILPRSDDEIATNIRSYILAFDGEKLLGYAALHIHAPNLAEVRSLIIDVNSRAKGVGSALIKELLKEARNLEVEEVFTLTYRKSFFEKLGFREISKSDLPAQKIWADCIKCKHFPICDEIALIIRP